jgi:transcriptional regulator with XRE-family HTH domain
MSRRAKKMICDGTKVAFLREKRLLTQFELATKSRVDPRTVQRMEAGKSVSGDTLKNVAAELGVLHHDLLRDSVAIDEGVVDWTGILLKPERSGRRLVEAILAADHLDSAWPSSPGRSRLR